MKDSGWTLAMGVPTLGRLARAARPPDPTEIVRRWKLSDDDEHAKTVVRVLVAFWQPWTHAQRVLLVNTAEGIARAETAKKARRLTPAEQRRYQRLARECIDSATRAAALIRAFPPPWVGDRAPIGSVIRALAELASSGLHETAMMDYNAALLDAMERLVELRRSTPKSAGRVSNFLIADLAHLAGGQQRRDPINERTVRRYERDPRLALPPGRDIWRKGFKTITAVGRSLRAAGVPIDDQRFRPALREFLRGAARSSKYPPLTI